RIALVQRCRLPVVIYRSGWVKVLPVAAAPVTAAGTTEIVITGNLESTAPHIVVIDACRRCCNQAARIVATVHRRRISCRKTCLVGVVAVGKYGDALAGFKQIYTPICNVAVIGAIASTALAKYTALFIFF